MKFGIFYEHQLPRPWQADSEYRLIQNSLSQIELADKLGYDYAWEVEHHFLEEYSHSSSPEVFLAAASQTLEEVIATGTLTPVRSGVAELALTRVIVRGLPVPSQMVSRVIGRITGRADDGRLEILMPQSISGFRVRPSGVTIYRTGGRR